MEESETYHKITQESEDVYSADYVKEENGSSGGVKGSNGANRLRNSWEPTIERDVGTPDKWDSNYNSDVQYSLRKYLKDSFIEYQKMKLLMFRTGAMKW